MNHDLAPHFPTLSKIGSTPELERSPLYRELQPKIDAILETVVLESFATRSAPDRAPASRSPSPPAPATTDRHLRVTAWNIERGCRFGGILEVLREHPEIRRSDILLLTELDHGMARSGNRHVAREIAAELGLDYAFAPSYLSLAKGSGLEAQADGENGAAIHGNAVFSRWPLRDAFSISLPNGKDKMRGLEKRLGNQRAVAATVQHPLGPVRVVSCHLDCHSSRSHRHQQMRLILDELERRDDGTPTVIGGDWNTSTYNAHTARRAILGFWRRVFMGIRNVVQNHNPHPDRFFERGLFRELESRGYRYRNVNQLGACTLTYDVQDVALNTNLADWIPGVCFPFIRWALSTVGGACSLKLDWFAVRGLAPAPQSEPRVVDDVNPEDGPLSDHLPILVDLVPEG